MVVNFCMDHFGKKDSETCKFTRRLKPRSHEFLLTIGLEEEKGNTVNY
jgi:hypothetical protein